MSQRDVRTLENTVLKITFKRLAAQKAHHHHHHHRYHHRHVHEGSGVFTLPCILKMKLAPTALPRSSYVSSSFWFIL